MAISEIGQAGKIDTPRRKQKGLFGSIRPSSSFYWMRVLAENKAALISGIFILVVIIIALLAPWLAPHSPTAVDPVHRLKSPSSAYWFGTDTLGRDSFSRPLYGARVSLLVGMSVMVASTILGSIIGLVSGYYSRLDTPIMRVMDGLMAFPAILLAIAIMASLGPKTINVIVALTVVYTPRMARLVRGMTLQLRDLPYVESAKAIGLSDILILGRYILKNALSPVIVQATFTVAYAILAEASLSFLGAGVPPEIPTWGNMLQDGQRLITRAWWLSVFPGVALFLTVLTLTLFGDGLRDALDPRARER
jgi:peptide/nickel transport system permease protein